MNLGALMSKTGT